jgi:hypothetical protein
MNSASSSKLGAAFDRWYDAWMLVIPRHAFLALILVLSGCTMRADSISTVTPVAGAPQLAPLADDAKVTIFSSEAEVHVPFTPVALIHYANPGKGRILVMGDVIPALQSRARVVGANAFIIDHQEQTASGVVSRGLDVSGRAVHIAE